jgi:hypothetical protein
LSVFQEGKSDGKDTLKLETNAEAGKVGSVPELSITQQALHYRSKVCVIKLLTFLVNCRKLKGKRLLVPRMILKVKQKYL